MNRLRLLKCAYIFHWSHSTYSYGQRMYEEKCKLQKLLKPFYEMEETPWIPYETDEQGHIAIELDGTTVFVTDNMILEIEGSYENASVIQGRKFKDLTDFYMQHQKDFGRFNQSKDGSQYWWGKTLKSMEFEMFKEDSICYYRMHFNNNRLNLIASNGKLYDAGGSNYVEISGLEALSRLGAQSSKARKIFCSFFAYITQE